MKNLKKVRSLLSMLIALAMIFTTGITCLAKDDVHTLITTPPSTQSSGGITTQGSSAPGSKASTHDLTVNNYNYQVQEVGAQVYTDKWLTGATSIKVTVNNWTKTTNGGSTLNRLTIYVINSKGKVISSQQIDPTTTNSVTLTGLTASAKYYVKFAVPTNGNKFSFDGTISK